MHYLNPAAVFLAATKYLLDDVITFVSEYCQEISDLDHNSYPRHHLCARSISGEAYSPYQLVSELLQENDGICRYLFAIIKQELFSDSRINRNKVPIDYLRNL